MSESGDKNGTDRNGERGGSGSAFELLERIRRAETESARRVAAARAEAERVVETARHHGADVVEEARANGEAEGRHRAEVWTVEADRVAEERRERGRERLTSLRQAVDAHWDALVEELMTVVLPSPEDRT